MQAQPTSAQASPEEVRDFLRGIIGSPEFEGSGRLQSFLEFVVTETLAGRGDHLKEYVIGVEVFKRAADFDPRTDSSVRVGANKLRSRIEEYYRGSGANDRVRISVPKGSYVPSFEVVGCPVPADRTAPNRRWVWLMGGLLFAALSCGVYLRGRSSGGTELRRIQVTSGPRAELTPSLSPDGSHVAFSSDLAEEGNIDIFIKNIETGILLRLSSDAARETTPAWSPDGRYVAFVRNPGYGGVIILASSSGGSEMELRNVSLEGLSWTADGKYLAALHRESQVKSPGFLLIDIETGKFQPLTEPASGFADYAAAFSPDGKQVAIGRCLGTTKCDVYLSRYEQGRSIEPSLTRVTKLGLSLHGLAWTGDSRSLIFSAGYYNDYDLWSVDMEQAPSIPRRIAGAMSAAHYPSIPARSPAGQARLAFQASTIDDSIWSMPLAAARGDEARPLPPIAPSFRGEWTPGLSPDGKRLVFASDRSGGQQVWIASADGSNPRAITSFKTGVVMLPRWSPVSDEIAFIYFDSGGGSDRALYTVRSDGSQLKRITGAKHVAMEPSWSEDGKWVYFASRASGQYQIWKISPSTGQEIQVTKFGGYQSIESNGMLYYTITGDGVWSVGVNGGQERKVLAEPANAGWFPVDDGLLFIPRRNSKTTTEISHWDPVSKTARHFATLPHPEVRRFTLDEKNGVILYGRTDRETHDIVVLDGYR
jgi:Tol biopolymer transport system component